MDALTGLFTRSYLNTWVGNKISKERSGALMLIGITGLDELKKKMSDDDADTLIKSFSERLQSLFRDEDIVCAVSRQMFATFVSGESGKTVIEKKAGMIVEIMGRYEEFEKYRDDVGVSIGISVCEENGLTFEELYAAANSALLAAAREGQNTYRFKGV